MDGTIAIRPSDRKVLLNIVKTANTHEQRLRAHILLLLDDGHTWATIAAVLYTSSSTINRWRNASSKAALLRSLMRRAGGVAPVLRPFGSR